MQLMSSTGARLLVVVAALAASSLGASPRKSFASRSGLSSQRRAIPRRHTSRSSSTSPTSWRASTELVVTTDWAGIAVALANKQVDIAWMGPWGYVLANNEGGGAGDRDGQVQRPAELSCDHRIPRRDVKIARSGPEDAKGPSGCRWPMPAPHPAGWSPPTSFKTLGIRPKGVLGITATAPRMPRRYLSVINDQGGSCVFDYDRNMNRLHRARHLQGCIRSRSSGNPIPLPNDPLVMRADLEPGAGQ